MGSIGLVYEFSMHSWEYEVCVVLHFVDSNRGYQTET